MNVVFEAYRYQSGELVMCAAADGEPVRCIATKAYLQDNFDAELLEFDAIQIGQLAEALKPAFAKKIAAGKFAKDAIRTVRL